MILANDLLLLLVTVMHTSLTASNPVGQSQQRCEEKLGVQTGANKEFFTRMLRDLKYGENLFVERLFYNTTSETKTRNLKPLDGITIPAGNMNYASILNSMSEISACLKSYLPKVIDKLITHENVKTDIRSHTRPFHVRFSILAKRMEGCWKEGELKVCPENLASNQTRYEMREHALGVLHTAVKWTESYTKGASMSF